MAYCINCGQELTEGAKFCANCGKAIEATKEQRKTVFDGELHKCPNCGERLDSFVTTCHICGYELRGAKVTSVVKELSQKLERTESIEQKIDLIRNFYIPNTKEDICEFFIFATSNISAGGYDVEAWYAKLEQTYQKARLSFNNTKEFEYINQLYKKTKKQKIFKSLTLMMKTSKTFKSLMICLFGGIITTIGLLSDNDVALLGLLGLPVIFCGFVFLLISLDANGKNKNHNENEESEDE